LVLFQEKSERSVGGLDGELPVWACYLWDGEVDPLLTFGYNYFVGFLVDLDGFVRAICSFVKALAGTHAVGAALPVFVAVIHHFTLFGSGAAGW